MSPVEFLQAIQLNYINELAAESANPKPAYSLDGQSVDWNAYRLNLVGIIEKLNLLMQMFAPTEIQTQAI